MYREDFAKEIYKEGSPSPKIFCFHLRLIEGGELFLTSHSEEISVAGRQYLTSSGVALKELSLCDSAEDYAILSGIYEEGGISSDLQITDAEISASVLISGRLEGVFCFTVTKFDRFDLSFQIRLEPLTYRYNHEALLKFSKSCRASLGDSKCGVEIERLQKVATIEKVDGNNLYLREALAEDGYFSGGRIVLQAAEQKISASIVKYTGKLLVLAKELCVPIQPGQQALLYPGCDKKLITCCNKFNNVLNFRGEPYVPDFKILEN